MSVSTAIACITLAEAKKHLQITNTDANRDDRLGDMINAISVQINNYCGRTSFVSARYTEYYDGNGGCTLRLKNYPITSTAASTIVNVDTLRDFTSDTQLETDDLILYPDEGKIMLNGPLFLWGPRVVKVVYTGGYAVDDIPADVKAVCKEGVARAWKKSEHGLSGVDSKSVAGDSQSFSLLEDLPREVMRKLDPYIRYLVG